MLPLSFRLRRLWHRLAYFVTGRPSLWLIMVSPPHMAPFPGCRECAVCRGESVFHLDYRYNARDDA